MSDFIHRDWQRILAHNHLQEFDQVWALEAPWFEEPNRRRGGWSGVSRVELALPEGGSRAVFLKRQENHGTFALSHPIRGVPTFQREFERIELYRSLGIPALVPVYFAVRRDPKGHRAILATEELVDYVSVQELVSRWLRDGVPPRAVRRQVLQAVADLLRRMHDARLQHSCFFPKHIYIRTRPDGGVEARVIDLEKSRRRAFRGQCAQRDLYSLLIPSLHWTLSDRLWFFKRYLGLEKLDAPAKALWPSIARRATGKGRVDPQSARSLPKLLTRT